MNEFYLPRRHPCPVPDCPNKRRYTEVLCPKHWYKVPKVLRDQVWEAYKKKQGSPDHVRLVKAAIEEASA